MEIQPELLQEWNKKGELIVIWGCERCNKKIPFYSQGNDHWGELSDMITLQWARDHKYCSECKKRMDNHIFKKKEEKETVNIISLLEKYEPPPEEEDV